MTKPANSPDLVLSLVDEIYSAALDPSLWQGVMKRIVDATGGVTGQLHSNSKLVLESLWAPHGFGEEVMGQYAAYYHQHDEWTLAADAGGLVPCKAITGEQLIQFGAFKNSEFYNDFLKHFGFERLVCCYVDTGKRGDLPKTALCVYRPPGSDPFDANALALINALAPHVRRAVQMHWRLHDLEHGNATNVEVLEQLITGVVLINEALRVTYLNRAAQKIIDAGDGLTILEGNLGASRANERDELSRLLGEAVRLTTVLPTSWSGTMAVTPVSGGPPYRISVVPAPRAGVFAVGRQRTAAIVLISEGPLDRRSSLDEFAQARALTPAEKNLAWEILTGATLKQAANRLGVSPNTAHTQLQSVFAKAGVHRSADLCRMILSGPGDVQS